MTEWSHKYYNAHNKALIAWCRKLHITPNQITIFNFIFTLTAGAYFFSRGHYLTNIIGLGVLFVNVILDYTDGALAKQTKQMSPVGAWLDGGGDVLIQNGIMAAVAFGLYRVLRYPSFSLFAAIMLYFVANAGLNTISVHYNNIFGFDSYTGSDLFRRYMEQKPTLINRALKNIVDPTSSAVGLVLFTVRYWIIAGALLNLMAVIFPIIAMLTFFRWLTLYILYTLHLAEYKKLWCSQALAIIDEDRQEYYALRHNEKV